MKTITLDDEAYQRLRSWKRSPGDSFSKVIKRVVPEAGTLGAMAKFVEKKRAGDPKGDAILEETFEYRSSEKADPGPDRRHTGSGPGEPRNFGIAPFRLLTSAVTIPRAANLATAYRLRFAE